MRWLLDEMLPPKAAERLRQLGHDALSVWEADLASANDADVFAFAAGEGRVIVTENYGHFSLLLGQATSDERAAPVLFVRKSELPKGGAMAAHLAERLHTWAAEHPDPYPAAFWL